MDKTSFQKHLEDRIWALTKEKLEFELNNDCDNLDYLKLDARYDELNQMWDVFFGVKN